MLINFFLRTISPRIILEERLSTREESVKTSFCLQILKKLEKIDYISTNKKTQILAPTTRGEMVYEVIKDSVPTMLNPTLTASWE